MYSVKKSLIVFGMYLMLIPGLGLMLFPEVILDLFQLSHGGQWWLARMVGLLAFIIGVFEFQIGKFALEKLYKWTVILRFGAATFMAGLWLTDQVEITILLFAAVDAAGAAWTWLAMKHTDKE